MDAAIEKGWVGVGVSLPKGALGGRRHVKWLKRPWIPKGTSVSQAPGGLAGWAGWLG